MNHIGVTVFLLCCYASTLAFVFEDCGSQVGTFNSLTLSSCDTSQDKCGFTRGTDISGSLKFTANQEISKIEPRIFGVLLDVPVPFPLDISDLCKDASSGIKCPLKKDQESEFKISLFLDKKVPSLSVEVIIELINEKDEKIICVKYPAKIL